MPLVEIEDLRVSFSQYGGQVDAVRGVSFAVNEGESLGIVGESGSGKSVSCAALLRLLRSTAQVSAGKIKGLRGAKLGNPYLRWAFGEAAVIAKRDHAIIGPMTQRLEARFQGNKFKANTVLAIKLARAVYFMLKDKTVFDPERLIRAMTKT